MALKRKIVHNQQFSVTKRLTNLRDSSKKLFVKKGWLGAFKNSSPVDISSLRFAVSFMLLYPEATLKDEEKKLKTDFTDTRQSLFSSLCRQNSPFLDKYNMPVLSLGDAGCINIRPKSQHHQHQPKCPIGTSYWIQKHRQAFREKSF